jgi:hypothetical protein
MFGMTTPHDMAATRGALAAAIGAKQTAPFVH